jgi:hypothetical protein
MTQLANVVKVLKNEHDRLSKQIQGISAALSAFGATYGNSTGTKRGKMSAEGRERIAAAQRLRWSKVKKATGSTKKRKTMSAAAKKKISLAQKARWSKQKSSA